MSDSKFIKFLKSNKDLYKILAVIGVGLLLIVFGSARGAGANDRASADEVGEICSRVDGVGECQVILYCDDGSYGSGGERVESIVVICEGGDSVLVKKRLADMLSSLYGIGTNRIHVEKMSINDGQKR